MILNLIYSGDPQPVARLTTTPSMLGVIYRDAALPAMETYLSHPNLNLTATRDVKTGNGLKKLNKKVHMKKVEIRLGGWPDNCK